MIKNFLAVTKPKIVISNLISTSGGFLLASKGYVDYKILLNTLISVMFIVSASCIYNNCIDINIDRKMERTRNRVLVKGLISLKLALVYASVLFMLGLIFLYKKSNFISLYLSIIGFFIYVIIYSVMKRISIHSILIGSLSGSVPPLIGYCTVIHSFDYGALILLFIFVFWQIPHSYAISILRIKEYQAASIPTFPIKCGIFFTKLNILFYIIGFTFSSMLLTIAGYTGYKYFYVITFLSSIWFVMSVFSILFPKKQDFWISKIFIFSIIIILSISIMISLDFTLPKLENLSDQF